MLVRAMLVLPVVLAVGCGAGPDDVAKDVFGSAQAVGIVENTSSVAAYRLASPGWYSESLSDYELAAGPIDVSDVLASKLRALLLDPSSYGWDYAKGCEPDYGVRIQFQNEDGTVDVLICFECDILTVYHNGKAVGGEDFDNVRPELLSIIKELFPTDEPLQAL